MTKVKKKTILQVLFLLILFFPLEALRVFAPLTIKSNYNTEINFTEIFVCESYNNCLNPEIKQIKLYDYNEVADCFREYNRPDIDQCISNGIIRPNNIALNAGETKRFVIETEVPDQDNYEFYFFIFSSNTQEKFVYYYAEPGYIDPDQVDYVNLVYYYFNGYPDYITLILDKYDFNGKGLVISNFNIENEVEVNLPLLVNLPIRVESSVCSEIKARLNQYLTDKYVPKEYLNKFFNIKAKAKLTIKKDNGEILKFFEDYFNVDLRVCQTNYKKSFIIEETGIYNVVLKTDIVDNKVKNSRGDQISAEVKVYDPNQQFCYTNIRNIEIKGEDDHIIEEGENITVSFEILSGENDGTGKITPKQSFWIVNLNNQQSYYGDTEASLDYKKITVNLGKLIEGTYSLKIKGYALDCSYQDNKEVV
ncbi:MAG TPA: hypothetical protein EYH54_05970, partial [Nautiliaceae bacterium]|nr:hypothetical protein [Nautiliaceae bacterium]